jgi:hypothetical protein
MADEGFLRRWARRKTESRQHDEAVPDADAVAVAPVAVAPAAPVAPADPRPETAPRTLPSMDDVARLTPDADFSAFVARDVDPAVRRSAMKKLFTDPHFHAMDGLDVYIDDYTKPSPVSAAMLASLTHAKRVLQPLFDEPEAAEPGERAEHAEPIEQNVAHIHAEAAPPSVDDPVHAAADPAPDCPTTPEQETQ